MPGYSLYALSFERHGLEEGARGAALATPSAAPQSRNSGTFTSERQRQRLGLGRGGLG